MGFLADFFLGKMVTKEFDLKPTKAIVTMEDGTTHVVSRQGQLRFFPISEGYYVISGESLVHGYLQGSSTIFADDADQLFPACKIAKISIEVGTKIETVSYRQ